MWAPRHELLYVSSPGEEGEVLAESEQGSLTLALAPVSTNILCSFPIGIGGCLCSELVCGRKWKKEQANICFIRTNKHKRPNSGTRADKVTRKLVLRMA